VAAGGKKRRRTTTERWGPPPDWLHAADAGLVIEQGQVDAQGRPQPPVTVGELGRHTLERLVALAGGGEGAGAAAAALAKELGRIRAESAGQVHRATMARLWDQPVELCRYLATIGCTPADAHDVLGRNMRDDELRGFARGEVERAVEHRALAFRASQLGAEAE